MAPPPQRRASARIAANGANPNRVAKQVARPRVPAAPLAGPAPRRQRRAEPSIANAPRPYEVQPPEENVEEDEESDDMSVDSVHSVIVVDHPGDMRARAESVAESDGSAQVEEAGEPAQIDDAALQGELLDAYNQARARDEIDQAQFDRALRFRAVDEEGVHDPGRFADPQFGQPANPIADRPANPHPQDPVVINPQFGQPAHPNIPIQYPQEPNFGPRPPQGGGPPHNPPQYEPVQGGVPGMLGGAHGMLGGAPGMLGGGLGNVAGARRNLVAGIDPANPILWPSNKLYIALSRGYSNNAHGTECTFAYQIVQVVNHPREIFQRRWMPGDRIQSPVGTCSWAVAQEATLAEYGRSILNDGNFEVFLIGNILAPERLNHILGPTNIRLPARDRDISYERLSRLLVRETLMRLRRYNNFELVLDGEGRATGQGGRAPALLDEVRGAHLVAQQFIDPENVFARFVRSSTVFIPIL
jgi:hypothetical protein